MRSREVNRNVRVAGLLLAAGLGLTACSSGGSTEARSSASASASARPEASGGSESSTTAPPSSDAQHPYKVLSGRIVNTEGVSGHFDGTWAYKGPFDTPEDQTKIGPNVLAQDATVQILCRLAVGRTINLDVQSSPAVIGKLGHTRTDWDLLQGPIPGATAMPSVTAGAVDAGGWVPSGFVDAGMKITDIPHCQLPS